MSDFSEAIGNSETFESEINTNSSGASDISSNLIEKQFSDLQNDILEQGRAIESFIKVHSATKNASETLSVLQTLFVLFKSALQMNINLRQIIVKNRSQFNREIEDLQKTSKEKNDFLKKAKFFTKQKITSFDDVIEIIKMNGNLEKENRSLLIQTQHLKGQIMDFEAQNEMELVSLRNRAESAENASNDLKSQIKLIQANNLKLEQTISEIEEKKAEEIEEYQKKSIEESKNSTNKLKSVHKKMIQMRKDMEQLQTSLVQLQRENEQYRISLNQVEKENSKLVSNIESMNSKKSEIAESMSQMKEKLSAIEEENSQSNSIISELKEINRKMSKALKKSIKENHVLKNDNIQLVNAIDGLNEEIDRLKHFLDFDDETNPQSSLKDIVQAFNELRCGLGLKEKCSPKKVARLILKKINEFQNNLNFNSDHLNFPDRNIGDDAHNNIDLDIDDRHVHNDYDQYYNTPLQNQIRSLQNEIDTLRNDLLTE